MFCGHEECAKELVKMAEAFLDASEEDPDAMDLLIADMAFNIMRREFKQGVRYGKYEWYRLMNFAWSVRDIAISILVRRQRDGAEGHHRPQEKAGGGHQEPVGEHGNGVQGGDWCIPPKFTD